MMSVPPDVASHLNISAEPIDVSIINKIKFQNGSVCTAASRGISYFKKLHKAGIKQTAIDCFNTAGSAEKNESDY